MEISGAEKRKKRAEAALWALGFAAAEVLAAGLVYCWRVFYYLDARGVSGLRLTLAVCAAAAGVYAAVFVCVRCCRSFAARAALCIFAAGLLFAAVNPPLQAPDESTHYLRAYAISEGHFDFDAARVYPDGVQRLLTAFPSAWVNAHTSTGLRADENGAQEAYSTAGYALKQTGADGAVSSIAEGFGLYFAGGSSGTAGEPLIRLVLPYLPAALAMALARLCGLGALGCLYAGRVADLAVYTFFCWAALRSCRRYRPVFLAVMLLPLSLYLAASMNYDAVLLGCYCYTAAFYCRDELRKKDLVCFALAFALMNSIKPWVNLLWLAVPLLLPKAAWKTRLRKGQYLLLCLAGALAVTAAVEWYGGAFSHNYAEAGRMLGDTVNTAQQLRFVLANPLRFIAVALGTLYENRFFVGQLGVFGALDLPIEAISLYSPCLLVLAAALSAHERASLRPAAAAGLGGLALFYAAAVMAAIYITYTPVGMVRIIGLQARYFLPSFLMLDVLLAACLSRVLEVRRSTHGALGVSLWASGLGALAGAVLLFQHYYIGPVFTI